MDLKALLPKGIDFDPEKIGKLSVPLVNLGIASQDLGRAIAEVTGVKIEDLFDVPVGPDSVKDGGSVVIDSGLLRVKDGQSPPWVDVAKKWMDKDEVDDCDELEAFLGVNPELTPWCAAFVGKCLEAWNIETTGDLRARSYADWGQECGGIYGAVAVFKTHVGFVQPDGKLLGGNQGNMVKLSNLDWYHKNMEFLGYRWPAEYELVV